MFLIHLFFIWLFALFFLFTFLTKNSQRLVVSLTAHQSEKQSIQAGACRDFDMKLVNQRHLHYKPVADYGNVISNCWVTNILYLCWASLAAILNDANVYKETVQQALLLEMWKHSSKKAILLILLLFDSLLPVNVRWKRREMQISLTLCRQWCHRYYYYPDDSTCRK